MVQSTTIALVSSKVPAHVQESMNRASLGNENVTAEHIQTPRVKLLQQMSSEVDENHDSYLEGSKPGHLLNTVTNENYGTEIYVVNIHFTEDFVVWRKREKGGGIASSGNNSLKAAMAVISSLDGSPDDYDITQTHTHLLLRKDPKTGELLRIPFLMDFSSSKLRVSRSWNTQIQQRSGDRFSTLWVVRSVSTANRQGQKFHNLETVPYKDGWVTDDDYLVAKKIYETVSTS